MKTKLIGVRVPIAWHEVIKSAASEKYMTQAQYLRELVRVEFNLPQPIDSFAFGSQKRTGAPVTSRETRIKLKLPRKAQDILMAMIEQTGWALKYVIQRIIEVDAGPMPSKPVRELVNPKFLKHEYSAEGRALGKQFWADYYQENPKSELYQLQFALPKDWLEVLHTKAYMNKTTHTQFLRDVVMTRLFGVDHATKERNGLL